MKYRRLAKNEIIVYGDEVDRCSDAWTYVPVWEPVHDDDIGKLAPDPQYPSHRQYRRAIAAGVRNYTDRRKLALEEEHRVAFEPLENQVSIGIQDRSNFSFTRNWFRQRNQSTWSTFFPGRFKSTEPHKMLQIGVFEGQDLVWCLQNILSHPRSRVITIDPWESTRKIDTEHMDAVMQRARVNLAQFGNQVDVNRGYSQQFLKSKHPALIKKTFDLAIIDGDHTADAVYQDAILTLPLMKKGSWMVFDDVRNRVRKKDHVQQGLDRFIRLNPGATQLAWRHRYCDCLEVL